MSAEGTHKYSLAGWLAIASGALVMPQVALSVVIEVMKLDWEIYLIPLHVVNAAVGVYILYKFRLLLHERYDFHRTDQLITILIGANIVFGLLGLGDIYSRVFGMAYELGWAVVSMALFVPYGIVTVVFGWMLLKLQGDLLGLLKPFAYTTIASGCCAATILLSPVGMLFGIAALVIQGIIFMRARDEVEYL